jgi:carboxypeptidase Taq
MSEPLDAILPLFHRISDLTHTAALLEWDQEVWMPDSAAASRAHQIATLRSIAHEFATSDELAAKIGDLAEYASANPEDDLAVSLARVATRDFQQATKLPTSFVATLAEAESLAKSTWRVARESDQFALFQDDLARVVDLNREKAALLGFDEHPYDALLDLYEPDLRASQVSTLFEALRSELVVIVATLSGLADGRAAPLHRYFEPDVQLEVGRRVVEKIGFDFTAGRQDLSSHPFCTTFSITDVRVTTRVDENFFPSAFYGLLHEMGHALYEQGINPRLERTPQADGTSLGMHESQSRLWENQVGRSRGFVEHVHPQLCSAFPEALSTVSAGEFHRAVNAVTPSLIRVEADEVTYNLHVMLRFELEVALFEDRLSVAELPEAWNDLSEAYLGLRPSNDAEGVLQDIHWAMGGFGYFPTYTIGNLMSAQLFKKAAADIGDLDEQFRAGQFSPLLDWLRENVHRFGRSRSADSILRTVTDQGLTAAPWLAYIRKKYADLYGTDL